MTSAWLILLTLLSPPANVEESSENTPRATAEIRQLNADEFREAYTTVIKLSARQSNPVPAEVVPSLVVLYRQLPKVEGLSFEDKRRMQTGLEMRLTAMRNKLLRKQRHARKPTQKSLPGGAPAAAQELIDLIESTIAPETWQSNGGQGTIRYFSLIPALVVRQSGEVHHQLGVTLDVLRQQ